MADFDGTISWSDMISAAVKKARERHDAPVQLLFAYRPDDDDEGKESWAAALGYEDEPQARWNAFGTSQEQAFCHLLCEMGLLVKVSAQ